MTEETAKELVTALVQMIGWRISDVPLKWEQKGDFPVHLLSPCRVVMRDDWVKEPPPEGYAFFGYKTWESAFNALSAYKNEHNIATTDAV